MIYLISRSMIRRGSDRGQSGNAIYAPWAITLFSRYQRSSRYQFFEFSILPIFRPSRFQFLEFLTPQVFTPPNYQSLNLSIPQIPNPQVTNTPSYRCPTYQYPKLPTPQVANARTTLLETTTSDSSNRISRTLRQSSAKHPQASP